MNQTNILISIYNSVIEYIRILFMLIIFFAKSKKKSFKNNTKQIISEEDVKF